MADPERGRQFMDRDDGGVALAPLKPADVLLAEAGHLGELLLGQALLLPDGALPAMPEKCQLQARAVQQPEMSW